MTAASFAAIMRAGPGLTGRDDGRLRRTLAVLLLLNELSGLTYAAAHGHPRVPLQLCDLAAFLTVWALWSPHLPQRRETALLGETPSTPLAKQQVGGWSPQPLVTQLAYFWALAASTQALLTPDLALDFPDYWWIKFFLTHGGTVLCAGYLAATGRVRPTVGSVWRIWGLTNMYGAIVLVVNHVAGTNYGYVMHKPMRASLLDYFGPWPWYLLAVDAAALGLFFVCYTLTVLGLRRTSATNRGGADGSADRHITCDRIPDGE